MLHLVATFILAYSLAHMAHHAVWATRFPGSPIEPAERRERYWDSLLLAIVVTFFVGPM